MISDIVERYRDFILYAIIGGACATFDFLIYTFIVTALPEFNIILANTISVLAGITLSFVLNRQYNFKVKDKTARRFIIFLVVGLSGLAISTFLIFLTVDLWNWNKLYAKLATIVVVSVFQFALNKTITFKKS